MTDKKTTLLYRILRALVRLCYPAVRVEGLENLPDGPCIIVGNHSQMHGPIGCELYFPGPHYIWCAGEMMHLRDVPAYAYRDFWSAKPKAVRWLYKLASYLIAPLSVCIFNNAHCIPVYHDSRIMSTFRETMEKLQQGQRVIIFPEHDPPHNHILYEFQDRFIDVAKMYHHRTGKEIRFVPLYIAPARRTMYLGRPISFHADVPIREERRRICQELMAEITDMACRLPRHTVVPYRNIPKRDYPTNLPTEVSDT